MSERYIKIDNRICPDCDGKMIYSHGDFIVCKPCGIQYKFNDDMGPGSYSATYIKGGRMWRQNRWEEILENVELLAPYYNKDGKIHKIVIMVKEELNKENDRE